MHAKTFVHAKSMLVRLVHFSARTLMLPSVTSPEHAIEKQVITNTRQR
jgi:hypothetical protein